MKRLVSLYAEAIIEDWERADAATREQMVSDMRHAVATWEVSDSRLGIVLAMGRLGISPYCPVCRLTVGEQHAEAAGFVRPVGDGLERW